MNSERKDGDIKSVAVEKIPLRDIFDEIIKDHPDVPPAIWRVIFNYVLDEFPLGLEQMWRDTQQKALVNHLIADRKNLIGKQRIMILNALVSKGKELKPEENKEWEQYQEFTKREYVNSALGFFLEQYYKVPGSLPDVEAKLPPGMHKDIAEYLPHMVQMYVENSVNENEIAENFVGHWLKYPHKQEYPHGQNVRNAILFVKNGAPIRREALQNFLEELKTRKLDKQLLLDFAKALFLPKT